MIKYIFVATIGGYIIGNAAMHDFFKTPEITQEKLRPCTFLYIQHPGDLDNLNSTFAIIKTDFHSYRTKFEGARPVSIYYDDAELLAERADVRSVAGLFVETSQKDVIEAFLKQHPEYKAKELPELNTARIIIPYRGVFSWFWMHRIIHPKVREYIKLNYLGNRDASELPIINVATPGKVEVNIPYGPGVDSLMVSTAQRPPHKDDK